MLRIVARLAFIAVCLAACLHAVRTFDFRFIDLDVYRWGGEVAFRDSNLARIGAPGTGLPFTYTPFGALVFALLAPIGVLTPVAWTVVSLTALVRASWLMARRAHVLDTSRGAIAWTTALVAAGVLGSHPGTSTLRLGQVGFVLLWLVCEDLLTSRRRSTGALTGIAAAIKLTPVVYLALLAIVGRWRAAAVCAGTILTSIALGFVLLPTESRTFWSHFGPDASTVGSLTAEDNWSINALVWRVAGDGGNDVAWMLLASATMVVALLLARSWWRSGDALGATGLVGLGSVLASPFSWSHHWVLVAPLFVALVARSSAIERRSRRLVALAVLAGCYALSFVSLWFHVPRTVLKLVLDDGRAVSLAHGSFLLVGTTLLASAWVLRPRQGSRQVTTTAERAADGELVGLLEIGSDG